MEFPETLFKLRKELGLTQDEMGQRIGLSGNYISLLEKGSKVPSAAVTNHITLIKQMLEAGMLADDGKRTGLTGDDFRSAPALTAETRRIPVLGWAHAGEAVPYEEQPCDADDYIPTDCTDGKAFAVRLEGESMEPRFTEGDLLILQPTKEPYNGCLAVCRFNNDGVVFRRVEFLPERVRLIAFNPAWPSTDHAREDFTWIYPVWGRWSQLWK